MSKQKIMEYKMIFKYNKETKERLNYLTNNLSGLYPSKSQVVRSAIHRLYNEKIRDKEHKKDTI